MTTDKFADFEERGGDVVGIWSGDPQKAGNPCHFIPIDCVMGDSKKFDKTKPSILIFGKLCSECLLTIKSDDEDDEDSDEVIGKPGDLIGVWFKPGMAALKNLGGVEVLLDYKRDEDGAMLEKDIGKGNPMKLYSVKSKTPGGRLQVRADRREKSKNTPTFLDDTAPTGDKAVTPGPVSF